MMMIYDMMISYVWNGIFSIAGGNRLQRGLIIRTKSHQINIFRSKGKNGSKQKICNA